MAIRFIGRFPTSLAMRVTTETKRLEVFDPNLPEWSHHRNVPFLHVKSGRTKPANAFGDGGTS
jgi:hypothetical protein